MGSPDSQEGMFVQESGCPLGKVRVLRDQGWEDSLNTWEAAGALQAGFEKQAFPIGYEVPKEPFAPLSGTARPIAGWEQELGQVSGREAQEKNHPAYEKAPHCL